MLYNAQNRLDPSSKGSREARWLVDASQHTMDCKGQTGMVMMLGGTVISSLNKQKINIRSVCKNELVGVDDAYPTIVWSLYFVQEQDIDITNDRLYRDNKSTILLRNNGKMSSSRRMKPIKANNFFITDNINQGSIVVNYLPAKQM